MQRGFHGEHLLRCESCAVRHRAVCGALERSEIERLNAIAHHKLLPPGQVILHDNAEMHYFANIVSGVVKLTKTLADGRQQIVGLQFASDFLGRPSARKAPTTLKPSLTCIYAPTTRASSNDSSKRSKASSIACSRTPLMNWTAPANGCCCSAARVPAKRSRVSC